MKKLLMPGILASLLLIYFIGPKVSPFISSDKLPLVETNLEKVQEYVLLKEASLPIKPGNQSYFVFADSVPRKRSITVLYLHGFAASPFEGEPVHKWFAQNYGANLLVPRLAEHGLIGANALLNFTAQGIWESAKEAYAIAKTMGDSVVIMGTSTGCTLALMLAARYPEIKALILLSPNIRLKDPAAFMVNNPWGLQIARLVVGADSFNYQNDAEFGKYWYTSYRLEGVAQLQELVEKNMTEETFLKLTNLS